MRILRPRINNANLDALAKDSLLMELIYARHPVDGVIERLGIVAERLAAYDGRELDARRVPRLDDGHDRLERVRVLAVRLDGDAVEEGRVKDFEDLAARVVGLELLDYGILVGSLSGVSWRISISSY